MTSDDWKACSLMSTRIVVVGVPFILVGFFAAILAPIEIHWRLVRTFLVCSCFYYASFGLWGSYAASRSVALLASEASRVGALDAFHPDHLAGLGFAKSYADAASMLVFSGVAVLPLGVLLVLEQLTQASTVGIIAAVLAAIAILAWGALTLLASLRGRYAIARALQEFRQNELDKIAAVQRKLLDGGSESEFWVVEMRERAVLRLRTNLLTELGGWKDLQSLFAASLAAGKIFRDVLSRVNVTFWP